jgi:4'-phosphopantetheinyl transferase
MPLPLPLSDRQVDLWYVFCHKTADPRLVDECRALLPPEDVAQEQRFVREVDRLQFVLSRALLRTALSFYTGVAPDAWTFARDAYGKPAVAAPAEASLPFNLSHSHGLVACAVTLNRGVGVDLEDFSRPTDHLLLARRYFHRSETAVLESLAPEERGAAFFRFWTLKEAFMKAHGMGLSIPLADVAFTLPAGRPAEVSFRGTVDEDPQDWQFAQLRLASRYQLALAVRFPGSQQLAILVREGLPLHDEPHSRLLPANESNQWVL